MRIFSVNEHTKVFFAFFWEFLFVANLIAKLSISTRFYDENLLGKWNDNIGLMCVFNFARLLFNYYKCIEMTTLLYFEYCKT